MIFLGIALIVIGAAGLIYTDLKSGWQRVAWLRRLVTQLEAVCTHYAGAPYVTPYRSSDLTNEAALQE